MSDEKVRTDKATAALAKAKAEAEEAERKISEYVAGLGIVFTRPEPLVQRDIESLMKTIRKHGGFESDIGNYERNGAQARAACALGWIDGLTVDAVDTTHPRVVTWLAQQVSDIFAAAFELPGE